jgi:GAF domain-containing protein
VSKRETPTTEYSESVPGASLEAILCTDELAGRPSRPPDRDLERGALTALAHGLSSSPEAVLQSLAETILKVFQCDSAGVSLVNDEDTRFHWPAIAGVWKPHIGGGTPRHFGPCGDVLHSDGPLLFTHFEKRYTYFMPVTPAVDECLLVPFYVDRKAVGTIWAITHEPPDNENSRRRASGGKFDREDLRVLESLGRFASCAYAVWMGLKRHASGSAPSERG